jgi:hypothetical protein
MHWGLSVFPLESRRTVPELDPATIGGPLYIDRADCGLRNPSGHPS